MLKHVVLCCAIVYLATAEPPVQGVKPTNVIGSSDQHASFSFVRPGLTQTAFSFGGPSSHQSFSSSIGNPQLAQRVLPSLANALAYRNPGLGYVPVGPISHGYANVPYPQAVQAPLPYQVPVDPAVAYYQQLQQLQQAQQVQQPQYNGYSAGAIYQAQLGQLLALRQAQIQAQAQAQAQAQSQVQTTQTQQVPEQIQLQQQEQQENQNLLGVAYSSAPSVAHVKVSGNGYKFDF